MSETTVSEGSLWIVSPEEPAADTFTYAALHGRPAGQLIAGSVAEPDHFFSSLLTEISSGGSEVNGTSAFRPVEPKRGDGMRQLKTLVVFANPKGSTHLRLQAEERVIRQCWERSRNRGNLHLEVRPAATIDDVARALLEEDYDIIHFSGHGTGQGLAFENELGEMQLVTQDALTRFLSKYSPPLQCVVLNACYSDTQGELFSSSLPWTIAMEDAISDVAAAEFTRGFYDAVGAGKNIEFAYKEGCDRIRLKGLEGDLVPVMFKRST